MPPLSFYRGKLARGITLKFILRLDMTEIPPPAAPPTAKLFRGRTVFQMQACQHNGRVLMPVREAAGASWIDDQIIGALYGLPSPSSVFPEVNTATGAVTKLLPSVTNIVKRSDLNAYQDVYFGSIVRWVDD